MSIIMMAIHYIYIYYGVIRRIKLLNTCKMLTVVLAHFKCLTTGASLCFCQRGPASAVCALQSLDLPKAGGKYGAVGST